MVLLDYPSNLVEGRFKARLNRFLALVEINGHDVGVHVANSGRMRELLVPGYRVLLRRQPGSHRKTGYDLALVDLGSTLASADARLPNILVGEALALGRLSQFSEYADVRREVVFGDSRLDFMLESPSGRCYLETKSVTLVVDGIGLFPDAPTLRGTKHMHSLAKAVEEGHRAAAIFVVQREDCQAVAPHGVNDPVFGAALRESVAAGVEVYAYNCRVTEKDINLNRMLPVQY
ncbi:MAG TPA: DNA/RNA nuclease SfsA [Dehalococcoidia bacterium]|nr:DNA/RNA nuclease SfsA [Dehalococcoidia bacterium]